MTQSHTYLPLDVTAEQRENLTKLADFLLSKPINDFDMRTFRAISISSYREVLVHEYAEFNPCGTVGCAVGHGPNAGIPPIATDDSWGTYAVRAFGAGYLVPIGIDDQTTGSFGGPLWNWCFDSDWAGIDNTARGAAKRIQIALTHGIPANHLDQCLGRAPLEYRA